MKRAKEKIREVFELQREYDKMVFAVHGGSYENIMCMNGKIGDCPWKFALMDEVGELIHEIKKSWCWWKFSQKPMDREKVLEELIDVWHFVFMKICYMEEKHGYGFESFAKGLDEGLAVMPVRPAFSDLIHYATLFTLIDCYCVGQLLGQITAYCGFTLDECVEAYKEKNAVNRQRLKDGY